MEDLIELHKHEIWDVNHKFFRAAQFLHWWVVYSTELDVFVG
jgi:hypothetical protein